MPLVSPALQPANQKQFAFLANFQSGLDLTTTDVGEGFSPAMCNVDPQTDGGLCTRTGVEPIHADEFPSPVCSISTFENEDSDQTFIMAHLEDGTVWVQSERGGTFDAIPTLDGEKCWRGIEINFKHYFFNGVDKPQRFEGIALTELDQTFNNTADPTNGSMPIASFMTVHQGRLWAADITEDGGERHCNRLRFSHAITNLTGQEDWNEDEYFDIDTGSDGDCITGIASCGDRLYVFKRHSVHQVAGFNADNFTVFPVDQKAGAVGCDAVLCCDGRMWFFDGRQGLHSAGSDGVRWEGESIYPIMAELDQDRIDQVSLGINDRRVMVSVPLTGGGWESYVLNLRTQRRHWTKYDLELGAQHLFCPKVGAGGALAASRNGNYILQLDTQRTVTDNFGEDDVPIEAFACSPWFGSIRSSIPNPFSEKEWHAVRFWIESIGGNVETDPGVVVKTFIDFCQAPSLGSFELDAAPKVNADDLGEHPAGDRCKFESCETLPQKLKSKTLQLCIQGPAPWCICSMLVEYTEKAIN